MLSSTWLDESEFLARLFPQLMSRVGLAHLIPAPFTQQVARALVQSDLLEVFFCTLIDEPDRIWQKTAKALCDSVGFDLDTNLKRRAVTEVPLSKVRSYPTREAIRMFVSRLSSSPVLGDHMFHWALNGFERWTASQLEGLDAIYGYEYGSLEMFRSAKQRHITRVYDLPSPEHDFVEELLAPEFDLYSSLVTPYRRLVLEKQKERTERRRQEWELSDLVVANSHFTANSWKSAGWSSKNVVVIPYGAPPIVTSHVRITENESKLRFLWAGSFSIRKGAHYLIDAVQSLSASVREGFVIDVYGAVTLPKALLSKVPENIRFRGSIPRWQLFEEMRKSDLLVFPTLCDGFGLVVNEAFAQGLPVLTTNRAGASDLVENGVNGWIVSAGDSRALADGIHRAIDQRTELSEMRESAQRTAKKWQWEDYRREIARSVSSLLKSP